MKRISFIGLLSCLLVSAVDAQAQTPQARSYAVVSLVGDQLDIVTYQMATGAIGDRNVHSAVPVTDGYFDDAALLAADEALGRVDGKAKITMLSASPPSWYAGQYRFFDGNKAALPAELMSAVRGVGATHLLLITKFRGDARLQAAGTKLGSGKLQGLGFYMDRDQPMVSTKTQDLSTGFLAPYVYLRLSLIDVDTSNVVQDQITTASELYATGQGKDGQHPWLAMPAEGKLSTIRRMLEKEIGRMVPLVTATR
jgi:hypothetical protein